MVEKKEPSAFNVAPPTVSLHENFQVGLATLLQAYMYAQDANVETWEFALEISELYKTGVMISDLRWLVAKGLAKHGQETSAYGDLYRSFCLGGGLNFKPEICFILTCSGATFARNVAIESALSKPSSSPIETTPSTTALITESKTAAPQTDSSTADEVNWSRPVLKPHWNENRRELWMADRLVKRFRVPARNQETILCSFEEEGWPQHIYDPLPPSGDIHPHTRLHDTIIRLNGRQINPLLRFHGNGKANGVLWKPIPLTRNSSFIEREFGVQARRQPVSLQ
jgi:hypothetical protein